MPILAISIINNDDGLELLSIKSNSFQNHQITSTKSCQTLIHLVNFCQNSKVKPIQITYPNFNIYLAQKNNFSIVLFYSEKKKYSTFVQNFANFIFKILKFNFENNDHMHDDHAGGQTSGQTSGHDLKLNLKETILKYQNNIDLHGHHLPTITSKMPDYCKIMNKYLKTGLLCYQGRIFSFTRAWYQSTTLEDKKLSILLSRHPELLIKLPAFNNLPEQQKQASSLIFDIDNEFRIFTTDKNINDLKNCIGELIGKSINFRKDILKCDNFDDENGILNNNLVAGRYCFNEVSFEVDGLDSNSNSNLDSDSSLGSSFDSGEEKEKSGTSAGDEDYRGSGEEIDRKGNGKTVKSKSKKLKSNSKNKSNNVTSFGFSYNFGSLGVVPVDLQFKDKSENYLEVESTYGSIYMKRVQGDGRQRGSLSLCLKCDKNYVFDIFDNVENIIG